jgi:hypothetical protein
MILARHCIHHVVHVLQLPVMAGAKQETRATLVVILGQAIKTWLRSTVKQVGEDGIFTLQDVAILVSH